MRLCSWQLVTAQQTQDGLTLVQRRRRLSNAKPALIQRLVSAGRTHFRIFHKSQGSAVYILISPQNEVNGVLGHLCAHVG